MNKTIFALGLCMLFSTLGHADISIPLPEKVVNLALEKVPPMTQKLTYEREVLGKIFTVPLGVITVSNYKIDFKQDSAEDKQGRVQLSLNFLIKEQNALISKTLTGNTLVSGKIDFNSKNNSFYLVDPVIEKIEFASDTASATTVTNTDDVKKGDDSQTQIMNKPISYLVKQMLKDKPIFTLNDCKKIKECSLAQNVQTFMGMVFIGTQIDNDNANLIFGVKK